MVVPSKLGMRIGALLVLGATIGCNGDVKPGLPADAGEDLFAPDDAGTTVIPTRDAGLDGGRDASRDATLDPRDEGTDEPDEPQQDAGSAPARDSGASEPGPGNGNNSKFLGDSRCTGDFLFCDDFESEQAGGKPDQSVWSAPFGQWPTVDGARAARGSKSLHFQFASGTPGHIEEKKGFPASNNSFYGRMFVWFKDLPTSTNAHWSIAVARAGGNEVRVDGQPPKAGEASRLGFGSVGKDDSGEWDWHTPGEEASTVVRNGAWMCIEWQLKGDTNETRMWIDDVEQSSLHLTSTEYRRGDGEGGRSWVFPQFEALRIGAWTYQADATPSMIDLWIDEVAIDDQRIGCTR